MLINKKQVTVAIDFNVDTINSKFVPLIVEIWISYAAVKYNPQKCVKYTKQDANLNWFQPLFLWKIRNFKDIILV